MSQNHASRIDGEVLGEQPGDDGLPGIGDYPPDQALGVDDPNLVADDDVAMREARTRSEPGAGDERRDGARAGDLLPPDDGPVDTEPQSIAERGDTGGDGAAAPAEVDAVRLDPIERHR